MILLCKRETVPHLNNMGSQVKTLGPGMGNRFVSHWAVEPHKLQAILIALGQCLELDGKATAVDIIY